MDKILKKQIGRAKTQARINDLERRLMEQLVDKYVQLRIYRNIIGG